MKSFYSPEFKHNFKQFIIGSVSLAVIGGLLLSNIACGKKEKTPLARNASRGGITSQIPEAQNQINNSQIVAQQLNINAAWEDVAQPVREGQTIKVQSSISYNGSIYPIVTSHSISGTSTTISSANYNISNDGVSVLVQAACSDVNCSQYVISYIFKKNNADAIQLLVWADFVNDYAPRIHSTTAGNFIDLNAWYNFASNSNNFLDP